MNQLYIAIMVRKKKIREGQFICEAIGPIVGVLFGSYFLSSHSKKYCPMIRKKISFSSDEFYLDDFSYESETFLNSDLEYAYYELQKVEDYNKLDDLILGYKEKYKNVCYYINYDCCSPFIIRYKDFPY